jgi:hypothetical protein
MWRGGRPGSDGAGPASFPPTAFSVPVADGGAGEVLDLPARKRSVTTGGSGSRLAEWRRLLAAIFGAIGSRLKVGLKVHTVRAPS